VDLATALTEARLALDDWEHEGLRDLGRDAARAVQDALRQWVPGGSDRSVAARIAAAVEEAGAQAPVLLVGGDDRLRSYRHPVAVGEALHRTVMAVLVAARGGQHVALTRYVSAGPVDAALAERLAAARGIHRRVLAACRAGAAVGQVVTELAAGYAEAGAEGGWEQHYQGGPIGYAQREFEIAPGQTTSPWWTTVLPAGSAVAWNPSLPGGAKDEDTYLVHEGEPELITTTADWPLADEQLPARPAVLVTGS
jgi:Xaa-Pro aminopeptidase